MKIWKLTIMDFWHDSIDAVFLFKDKPTKEEVVEKLKDKTSQKFSCLEVYIISWAKVVEDDDWTIEQPRCYLEEVELL